MERNPETPNQVVQWMSGLGYEDPLDLTEDARLVSASGQVFEPAEMTVSAAFRCDPGEVSERAPGPEVFAIADPEGEPVGTLLVEESQLSDEAGGALDSLRGRAAMPEEVCAERQHRHVAAVFPDRDSAEGAVEELRAMGLGSDHLGVAVHGEGRIVFERDEEVIVGSDAAAGTVAGAGLGALAGMALTALAIPGLAPLGIGGLFAIGAATGFGGAMLGGFLGIAAADEAFSAHGEIRETPLEPGEVLLAVLDHGRGDEVEEAMRSNGGRLLTLAPSIP